MGSTVKLISANTCASGELSRKRKNNMGYEPVVNCRQCGDALDVYAEISVRFCSEECAIEYWKDRPLAWKLREEAKEIDPV
jgi:hypothetical protein